MDELIEGKLEEESEEKSEEETGLVDRAMKKMLPKSVDMETKIKEMLGY